MTKQNDEPNRPTDDREQAIAPASGRGKASKAFLALALLVGAAGITYTMLAPGAEAVAEVCEPSVPVVEAMAPHARGEVAAVNVHSVPRLPPEMEFTGPDGEPLTLEDFAGRTVLVNFWATWCAPCREEMPALNVVQTEFGGDDFEVVAINVDTRNLDKPRAWLEEHGIHDLRYFAENDGVLLQTLQRSGHVVGLPTTVIFGPQNCELAILRGYADWTSDDAFQLLREALSGTRGSS
ncbi:MAG: TlpA family protein disulfide reductase [Salinarimonas sp.]|nr:TlpA family protein disulfide reductase [Salinarimonas sp.]